MTTVEVCFHKLLYKFLVYYSIQVVKMMKNFYENGKQESINGSTVFRKPSSTRVKLVTQQVIISSMEPDNFLAFNVIIVYDNYNVILFNHLSIVEISTASPSGMQLTSLRNHGQICYRNVTWYPSQHQIGQQLFCFKARDSAG